MKLYKVAVVISVLFSYGVHASQGEAFIAALSVAATCKWAEQPVHRTAPPVIAQPEYSHDWQRGNWATGSTYPVYMDQHNSKRALLPQEYTLYCGDRMIAAPNGQVYAECCKAPKLPQYHSPEKKKKKKKKVKKQKSAIPPAPRGITYAPPKKLKKAPPRKQGQHKKSHQQARPGFGKNGTRGKKGNCH